MNTGNANKNHGYNKCRVVLHQCLAIVVRKEGCKGDPGDFWMYENGYLLFQGLLSSNSICWWNTGLNGATKSLIYYGYISPGALLVGSEPCAIDILKNAWARRVLQAPPGYQIVALEEIEHCTGVPVVQTQWTPLPEAVCAVILRLSRQGRPAGIETIREALILTFPHVSPPTEEALYDTLAQLTTERKLYHTSNGYFIVTPERRRSRSHSRGRKKIDEDIELNRTMLMSTEEALMMVHGDMATIRDGDVTHQMIQTNLADVICGGNSSDKILYARKNRAFSVPRSPDRRGSFRLWRSSRRLRRSASTRSIAKNCNDSTSSTDGSSNNNNNNTHSSPIKKESLLTRLFRKPKRQCQINSFSAQFPPTEWFNSKAVHLHSTGTQTCPTNKENTTTYLEDIEVKPSRAATLPRRRYCRQFSEFPSAISREHSPYSPRTNPLLTLPRNSKGRDSNSRKPNGRKDERNVNKNCDSNSIKTSQKTNKNVEANKDLDNSGPSSIESHKESSITSGPSSLESHKTVINRNDFTDLKKSPHRTKTTKINNNTSRTSSAAVSQSNSFTLQVTTNQSKLNNKPNATTTTTINGEHGNSTKIFVQNSPIRSVITFENGKCDNTNPNLVIINDTEKSPKLPTKNTNQSMNNSRDLIPESLDNKTMNNRKLSLQLPAKDINFHNLIKNVNHSNFNSNPDSPITDIPKGCCNSTPPSPSSLQSIDKYTKNEGIQVKKLEKNMLGSEPNICYKDQGQFPSLNDLSFNFTSLAAQKILKGVGLNSVDTLVELNMTNMDKPNNICDVVHTDFGLF